MPSRQPKPSPCDSETACPLTLAVVDVVLLTLVNNKLHVVLTHREKDPLEGKLALPGGYVHPQTDSDSLASARRMLLQKTGIKAPYLEQLYTFSGRERDPRGWSISVAYYALVTKAVLAAKMPDNVVLVPVDELPELAFDHNEIVAVALNRLRSKAAYSVLPCYLLPAEFTLAELQATYEQVLGTKLSKSSFRRKLDELGFLEPLAGQLRGGKQRPAQLFRLKKEKFLTTFDRTL